MFPQDGPRAPWPRGLQRARKLPGEDGGGGGGAEITAAWTPGTFP